MTVLKAPNTVNELIAEIKKTTDKRATALLGELEKHLERRKRILDLVKEAMQQLRVDLKYVIFDLECTRKERDALKAQLEDRGY